MALKKNLLGGLLLLVAGGSLGWSLRRLVDPVREEAGSSGEEEGGDVDPAAMSVRVSTAPVETGDLPVTVAAAGVVRAAPSALQVVSSRAGGRVLETHAAAGQPVARGDVLLRFDPAPLQAALLQARATETAAANQLAEFEVSGREQRAIELESGARRATSQLALLEAQVERLEPLHAEGLVSDRSLAEAKQAAEQGRADLGIAEQTASAFRKTGAELQHATLLAARAASQAGAQEAERMLAEAEVLAPCDGQLVAFQARLGEKLEPGAVLGEILAREGRVVVFSLAAATARRLKIGAPVTWEAQGARGTGTLAGIGGEVESASGLLEGIVAPDPGVTALPPGLFVRGEIETERLRGVLLVPERAVLRAEDAQVVVVADGERARVVPVTLAGRHGGLAAIEGDVKSGDRVVVEGGYHLPDGARILEDPPAK